MNKLLAVAVVSIGLITVPVPPAMAQTSNPAAAGSARTPQGERRQHEQRALRPAGERIEARLAQIKTALKITDAQESQWHAFAETLRRQAASRDQHIQSRREGMTQRGERVNPTAIDRLERQQQMHATAAAQINERLAVQNPLYAALTAEQKQVADRVLAPRGENGRFRHRGMHRQAGAGAA